MSSTVRVAWRNLWRNPGRTALTMMAIGIAQFALVFSGSVFNGYLDSMSSALTGPMLGNVQVHAPRWRETRALEDTIARSDELAAELRQVGGVTSVSQRIYAPVLIAAGEEARAALVVGVDVPEEAHGVGLLSTIAPADLPAEHRVAIGRGLADRLGATVGSEIAIVGQAADGSVANDLYRVSAVLRSSMQEVERAGIVMSLSSARALFVLPDGAHELVVRAARGVDDDALAARVSALPAAGGLEVLSWRKLVPLLAQMLDLGSWVTAVVAILVYGAAAAGIVNTMMMSVFERRRETGMLLALGSSPGRILRMLAVEALALGALGVIAGTLAGSALALQTARHGLNMAALGSGGGDTLAYQGMNIMLRIFPRLALKDVVVGVCGVLLTTFFAMLWPGIHAARMQPAEGLRA